MLRSVLSSCFRAGNLIDTLPLPSFSSAVNSFQPQISRCFSALATASTSPRGSGISSISSLNFQGTPSSDHKLQQISPLILQQQSRSLTKFSMSGGKRRTIRAVPARFYRLEWGAWVRRMAGCTKQLWRKSNRKRMRLERHVLVGSTKSFMLDKMVGMYYRTPKYWVDDPYAPYHKREEFALTRTKPRPLPPGVTFSKEL